MLEATAIIVGVVSGVSGLLLGILNYLEQRNITRPKLRVRPRVISLIDREEKKTENNVGVMEVSNIGSVPVIGSTIGFLAKRKGEKGILVVSPQSINDKPLTGELKPGHVTVLRMSLENVPDPNELGRAYVATIVGDVFRCSRRDMKEFRDALTKMRNGTTKG